MGTVGGGDCINDGNRDTSASVGDPVMQLTSSLHAILLGKQSTASFVRQHSKLFFHQSM
jgi:hypothetical protein